MVIKGPRGEKRQMNPTSQVKSRPKSKKKAPAQFMDISDSEIEIDCVIPQSDLQLPDESFIETGTAIITGSVAVRIATSFVARSFIIFLSMTVPEVMERQQAELQRPKSRAHPMAH